MEITTLKSKNKPINPLPLCPLPSLFYLGEKFLKNEVGYMAGKGWGMRNGEMATDG